MNGLNLRVSAFAFALFALAGLASAYFGIGGSLSIGGSYSSGNYMMGMYSPYSNYGYDPYGMYGYSQNYGWMDSNLYSNPFNYYDYSYLYPNNYYTGYYDYSYDGYGGYGSYNGYDSCYLSAPYYGATGQFVPIGVNYAGTSAPYSTVVECGNGKTATAYGGGGSFGTMYAYCNYDLPGAYTASAFSGISYCSPTEVIISGSGSSGYQTGGYYYNNNGGNNGNGGGKEKTNIYVTGPYNAIIKNNAYMPSTITVKKGSTVTWTNLDGKKHTVTADDGNFSGTLKNGKSFSNTFNEAGTYTYHCNIHPGMKGTVIVEDVAEPVKTCALTSLSSKVQAGGTAIITANYYSLSSIPNVVSIDCGNGNTANAVSCLGETGSCSANCYYPEKGTFTAVASADGTACSGTDISVTSGVSGSGSAACSDGTDDGSCSTVQQPKFCESGFLVDRAGLCGCPTGYKKNGDECKIIPLSCTTTMSPSAVRANEASTITVSGSAISETPLINCGNGQTPVANCTFSNTSGACTASCNYGQENLYPVTYTAGATANGVECSSASMKVISPLETTGSLTVRASDCKSGEAISNAVVAVGSEPTRYTDANGEMKISLNSETYNIEVSKTGYGSASATAGINNGSTTLSEICLEKVPCSVTAELVTSPDTADASSSLLYQIKLKNNLNESNGISLSYSPSSVLTGESTVDLGANEEKIINVNTEADENFVGSMKGTVGISGANGCSESIELPIKVVGGVSLEALQDNKSARAGEQVCFDLIARNRGKNAGTVVLSYSPDGSSGSFNAYFSGAGSKFHLADYEIRDNVQFCTTVPNGASTGAHSFLLKTESAIGSDSVTEVNVNVPDIAGFSAGSAATGCTYVNDATAMYPITISNNVEDGDYAVELQSNDVAAGINPIIMYGFKKGTSRTVYLSADPRNFNGIEKHIQLALTKNGAIAMQQDLCLRTSASTVYDLFTQLSRNSISLKKGASEYVEIKLRNVGTTKDTYLVSVDSPLKVSVSPSSVTLDPNEEREISIKFSAGIDEATTNYLIPITVYSQQGSGSTTIANNNTNGVIYCGNGQTVGLSCSGSTGSCSASCTYSSTGTYTITAGVGDTSCSSNTVKVINNGDRACAISASSYASIGKGITVNAMFQNLSDALDDEDMEIDCGNGDNATASGCDGTTGSCSSTCPYPSSGTYTLRTSIGNLTCETATVRVAGDYNTCGITPKQKIVVINDPASVTLDYNNVNMNNLIYGGVYTNYSYGQRVLAAQENLAIYVSGTATTTVNPLLLQADALEIEKVTSGEIPSTGKATIAVTVRNNDDYATQITGVFLSKLPSGLTALQVTPMTIRGNERKTIYVQVQASKAKTGSYKSTVEITHSGGIVTKDFSYSIVPESATVKVSVKLNEAKYFQQDGKGVATFVFSVRNEEDDSLKVSAVVTGMPASWTQGSEPALEVINSGEEKTFTVTINAGEYERKTYPATLEIRNSDGRKATVPIVIEMDKTAPSPFAGFFTLGSSNNILFIVAVLLVLGIGYLVYRPVAKVRGNASEYRSYLKDIEEKGGTEGYGSLLKEAGEETVIGNENIEDMRKGGEPKPAEAAYPMPIEVLPEKKEEAAQPAADETIKYWEIFEEVPEKTEETLEEISEKKEAEKQQPDEEPDKEDKAPSERSARKKSARETKLAAEERMKKKRK